MIQNDPPFKPGDRVRRRTVFKAIPGSERRNCGTVLGCHWTTERSVMRSSIGLAPGWLVEVLLDSRRHFPDRGPAHDWQLIDIVSEIARLA